MEPQFRINSDVFLFDANFKDSYFPHNPHIMIIDDDRKDIELFEHLIHSAKGFNFSLTKFLSAREAIDFLKNSVKKNEKTLPDLIILDINMPEISGKEVLKQLQVLSDENNIKIIMYSSMSNTLDVIDVAQLGSRAYFQKPLQVDKFLNFIKQNAG